MGYHTFLLIFYFVCCILFSIKDLIKVSRHVCHFYLKKNIYLAMLSFSCGMWDLIPWPGIKSRPPALGSWGPRHWTSREVPLLLFWVILTWLPTPALSPGKSHGWRSLVGCSPWDLEQSDTTEQLPFHFSLSCIGEGNGNPLQCSCLENPRDGGAWWAAVYGVAQSRTWLKRLSSSSSSSSSFPCWFIDRKYLFWLLSFFLDSLCL